MILILKFNNIKPFDICLFGFKHKLNKNATKNKNSIPEDPAFSTGGRHIFICKYPCIRSTYSNNQNKLKISNQSSI